MQSSIETRPPAKNFGQLIRKWSKETEISGRKEMKKLLMAGAALALMASGAAAERYVVITHTQGTDPFWPVVHM